MFHLHVHVIPRKEGVAMKPPASEKEKPETLADYAKKLAAASPLEQPAATARQNPRRTDTGHDRGPTATTPSHRGVATTP